MPDQANGFSHLHQLYTATDPRFTGRVTVPALWDKQRGVIVNNESADIIRMLNGEFARMRSRSGSPTAGISSAIRSPRPTGGGSRHCFGSMRSTTGTEIEFPAPA